MPKYVRWLGFWGVSEAQGCVEIAALGPSCAVDFSAVVVTAVLSGF
jgi:hypothetical protein